MVSSSNSWRTWDFVGLISLVCLFHITSGFCPVGWTKMENSSKCVKFTSILSNGIDKYRLCEHECANITNNELECKPIIIKNASEQNFVASLFANLTMTLNQDKDVWLGMKMNSKGDWLLEWTDGYNEEYTNWQSSRIDRSCVVLIVNMDEKTKDIFGQWRQVPCQEKHHLMCEIREKPPKPLSLEDLLRKLNALEERIANSNLKINNLDVELKSNREELDIAKVKLYECQVNHSSTNRKLLSTNALLSKFDEDLTSTKAELINSKALISKCIEDLTSTRRDVSSTKTLISKHNDNLRTTDGNLKALGSELKNVDKKVFDIIPKGFIYVQYPHQNWATPMWPQYNWTEVTHRYSGHFFRAQGGGSASFGAAQGDNAPRITEIDSKYAPYPENKELWSVSLSPGTSTARLWTGDDIPGLRSHVSTRFTTSGGEVRPKNYGIKLFRRD